jgi:hypothetical protein
MRAASRLLNYSARLTLFTRQNCSLCDTAKQVVANVQKDKILDYSEIDVMAPGQEKWKDAYEFDTPVVSRGVVSSKLCLYNYSCTSNASFIHIPSQTL